MSVSKKKTGATGKQYRAMTDINTDTRQVKAGEVLDTSLISAEALEIFLILGHVVEETDGDQIGDNNG